MPEPGHPQAYNRYAYVYNNPLKYSDPTGHEACWGTDLIISKRTGDGGVSTADCWAEQAKRLKLPAWDPAFDNILTPEEKMKAEQAFIRLIFDPAYFADIYVDPELAAIEKDWEYLSWFAEYSELHTTADNLVFLRVAEVYGPAAASNLSDAALNNISSQACNCESMILGTSAIMTAGFVPNP